MKNFNYQLKWTINAHLLEKRPLKHWKMLILLALGIISWMGLLGASSVQAATFCVNPGGTDGCYALPSAAVAAAEINSEMDVIMIQPGTYAEPGAITFNEAGLKILGDNPVNTIVQNSILDSVFVLTATADNVEIANLTITGGGHGIEVQGESYGAIIHHNIIRGNGAGGIYGYAGIGPNSSFIAFNNVVCENNEIGIRDDNDLSVIYNNIVFTNGSYGIRDGNASYNSSYNNGTNGTQNYYSTLGNIDNISQDCLFVDLPNNNYTLQPTSPCKDTGNPGYFDADGTRSDMGSFGGPAAALFWPYGDGGPVVTNLTVDPSYVPEGGNISIKATVEIR